MEFSTEKLSGNKVKIAFTIAAADFDAATHQAYLKMRGRVNVPGFRKGKAPRKLIESMYGEGVFYDDALDAIFPDAYQEAVTKGDLHPVDRPELDIQQIAAGQDLKFTAEVFVLPDVTLGDYKSLKAVKHVHDISEEQIEHRISHDVDKATLEQEVTDRPAKEGDIVRINYLGEVDGVAFEGGQADDQRLELGSNSFIPGFEEQVVGMQIGEEKDLNLTFPEQYHAEDLAGRAAVFHVKLLSITERVKPEMDDDFAADVSPFTTFDEYKESVVKELTEQRDRNAEVSLENDLIQQAVDQADCDIPEAMIEDELDSTYRNWGMQLAYQGISAEDFMNYTGQTEEQIREMMKPEAANKVKTQLVLDAIAKAEAFEPSQEAIDKEIDDHARQMNRELDKYKEGLSERQLSYYKDLATSRMVIDLLKENAEITIHDGPAHEHEPIDMDEIVEKIEEAAEEGPSDEAAEEEAEEETKEKKAAKPRAKKAAKNEEKPEDQD